MCLSLCSLVVILLLILCTTKLNDQFSSGALVEAVDGMFLLKVFSYIVSLGELQSLPFT